MDNQEKLLRRLIALSLLLVLCGGTAVAALFSLQLINGEEYRIKAERRLTSNMTVTASRGEMLDRYGRPLVTNRTVFSLRIDYAYWDKETQNETILKLAQLVQQDGATVEDTLPISVATPFAYTGEEEDRARKALEKYADKKDLGANIPADQMMQKLKEVFEVDGKYSDAEARTIVGVRYEMAVGTEFSVFNPHVFAHDVSMDLVSMVKERHKEFAGVDVQTEPVREYKTEYAAHILGRVGRIYKEEWDGEDGYKAKGYAMNAMVGKDGMEKVLEPYLRGTNGSQSVETNVSGNVTGVISSSAPQPGNNCVLTLDLMLQQAAEDALKKRIGEISQATAGAAVVVQVNTGEVLAMASYPSYNLATFNQDYNSLYTNPLKPMVNRATSGTYAPGSTFKPLTAIAALEEGAISTATRFTCNRSIRYLNQQFRCTGSHGSLDVEQAIKKSCNIFFYNTGIQLGRTNPDAIRKWAKPFGLGEKTGIELGESRGQVASPAGRKEMLENAPYLNAWQPGDYLQAAIGQSDNLFTPLQMANFIATIASDGKHYQAHLVKSIKSYDFTQTIQDDTPTLLNTVEMKPSTLNAVKVGMKDVVSEGGTAARVFANYPIQIAGKSGTAQLGRNKTDNGLFVASAPYENPEIAICVVIEGGKSGGGGAAPVVRDILDAYFAPEQDADTNTDNIAPSYTLLK